MDKSSTKRILVVDDDMDVNLLIESILTTEGYTVATAYDGKTGLEKAKEEKPDLIILDVSMPHMDGFTLCRYLREDIETRFIPLIMLTGLHTQPIDRITGLKIGADDYLVKPFEAEELKRRIERLIVHTGENLTIHPLTRLPGSYAIEEEVTSRINRGERLAVCYFDIDNFKSFNDRYGYMRGDQVIHLLSRVILNAIQMEGTANDFLGHIGGDDFILVTVPDKVDKICQKIIQNFDEKIPLYYDSEDRKQGFINLRDRLGNLQSFPLMTVSIAVVTNEKREITHYAKLIDVLSEVKDYVKSTKNERKTSTFIKDRRREFYRDIAIEGGEKMAKKTIEDMDLTGKRVLVRVDYNVPLDKEGNITDDTRIKETLPTINFLLGRNCKVVLISHLGRPKGKPDPKYSLKPVVKRLSELLGQEILFDTDCISESAKKQAENLKPKQVLLLENLRFYAEEEKNDSEFARKLASLGEMFIQDAFGTVHRAHASTAGIPAILPSGAGFLLKKEIEYLGKALENPVSPFLTILGGAKVSDKIGVISNLMNKVNSLIIGGAMAYTFLKAQGIEVGDSLVETDKVDLAKEILKNAEKNRVSILLPLDHIVADKIDAEAQTQQTRGVEISGGWRGADIGSMSIVRFASIVKSAKTIVWNGPLGVFEIDKFAGGTLAMAEMVAEATDKGAISIIGGGDTVAAVAKAGVSKRMSHISTGGGASLEFLEGKTLPGIAALQNK